ncbi:hypothetical protein LEP1GSC077_3269 [Leptospira interrogans str. C10069]|nr:hypothetical protein LEP1GSC077_3269 [Leptospira interrogans str. C10069]
MCFYLVEEKKDRNQKNHSDSFKTNLCCKKVHATDFPNQNFIAMNKKGYALFQRNIFFNERSNFTIL